MSVRFFMGGKSMKMYILKISISFIILTFLNCRNSTESDEWQTVFVENFENGLYYWEVKTTDQGEPTWELAVDDFHSGSSALRYSKGFGDIATKYDYNPSNRTANVEISFWHFYKNVDFNSDIIFIASYSWAKRYVIKSLRNFPGEWHKSTFNFTVDTPFGFGFRVDNATNNDSLKWYIDDISVKIKY